MKPTVFIQTNDRQMVGALVSAYSLHRNSRHADRFEVRIMRQEDHAFFQAREGQTFLRGREHRVWRNDDLQSFTPLRFLPPELMAYDGRAVVIDPDIFAVGDIYELLSRDMQGKALMCRARPGHNGRPDYLASSVMLLDCGRLTHWRCEAQFNELFAFERDYLDWIELTLEPRETIGLLEAEWNDFDRLTERTRLLHNTKRRTQPWKTGLPVDFVARADRMGLSPWSWVKFAKRQVLGDERYKRHPDPRQEQFFFGLLRECVEKRLVTEDFLRAEMRRNHLRHDALELLDRTPTSVAA